MIKLLIMITPCLTSPTPTPVKHYNMNGTSTLIKFVKLMIIKSMKIQAVTLNATFREFQ